MDVWLLVNDLEMIFEVSAVVLTTGTVFVPPMTNPEGPKETTVPSIVAAAPPIVNVVPLITMVDALGDPGTGVTMIVWPPTARTIPPLAVPGRLEKAYVDGEALFPTVEMTRPFAPTE